MSTIFKIVQREVFETTYLIDAESEDQALEVFNNDWIRDRYYVNDSTISDEIISIDVLDNKIKFKEI